MAETVGFSIVLEKAKVDLPRLTTFTTDGNVSIAKRMEKETIVKHRLGEKEMIVITENNLQFVWVTLEMVIYSDMWHFGRVTERSGKKKCTTKVGSQFSP